MKDCVLVTGGAGFIGSAVSSLFPAELGDLVAVDVLHPHEVLALIPSVIDSESLVPLDALSSRLPEPVRAPNGARSALVWPRPLLRPVVRLVAVEAATESAVPTVLV